MKTKTHVRLSKNITFSSTEKRGLQIGLKGSCLATENTEVDDPTVEAKRSSLGILVELNLNLIVLKIEMLINIFKSFIRHIWMNVFTNSVLYFLSSWR